MGTNTYLLTQDKVNELEKELHELETKGRRDIADSLNWLRDLPSSQEDDDFSEVLDSKRYLEKRIDEVREILSSYKVINEESKDVVNVGSTVKVGFEGYEEKFKIVSAIEADPLNKKISDESPVGKALIGMRIGDKVLVDMGGIKKTFRVLDIE